MAHFKKAPCKTARLKQCLRAVKENLFKRSQKEVNHKFLCSNIMNILFTLWQSASGRGSGLDCPQELQAINYNG